MSVDEEISLAWREAAVRLGVRVIAPYELQLSDGGVIAVEAFLPDFGGSSGAVAVAIDDDTRARLAAAAGPYVSRLSSAYRSFDEQLFRETLDDWGWCAPASPPPPWYTGRPWSDSSGA